jgi:hypothetical protein
MFRAISDNLAEFVKTDSACIAKPIERYSIESC